MPVTFSDAQFEKLKEMIEFVPWLDDGSDLHSQFRTLIDEVDPNMPPRRVLVTERVFVDGKLRRTIQTERTVYKSVAGNSLHEYYVETKTGRRPIEIDPQGIMWFGTYRKSI